VNCGSHFRQTAEFLSQIVFGISGSWPARNRSWTYIPAEPKTVTRPVRIEPVADRVTVERLPQTRHLVLRKRIERIQNKRTQARKAAILLMCALADARMMQAPS
jgi:hypothetical protein